MERPGAQSEDDGAVRRPHRAPNLSGERTDGRDVPVASSILTSDAPDDPLLIGEPSAVRGEKWPSDRRGVGDRRGRRLIETADEQRAHAISGADIRHEVACGRDGKHSKHQGIGQRRRRRGRKRQARQAAAVARRHFVRPQPGRGRTDREGCEGDRGNLIGANGSRARAGTGVAHTPGNSRRFAATSPALCQRSSGSFASALRITSSSHAGATGCASEIGAGCRSMMAAIVLAGVAPLNARAPGQHFVEHAAEREDVGAVVGLLALDLLRRHVVERAEDRARRRSAGAGRRGSRPRPA